MFPQLKSLLPPFALVVALLFLVAAPGCRRVRMPPVVIDDAAALDPDRVDADLPGGDTAAASDVGAVDPADGPVATPVDSAGTPSDSGGGDTATADSAPPPPVMPEGLGAFAGIDFGALSDGGSVTFQNIGAAGSYPSVCAPNGGACCRKTKSFASDQLTPWSEELIMNLRGPLDIRQFATYQPASDAEGAPWQVVSSWDARSPTAAKGISFAGSATPNKPFAGVVGSGCLIYAATDKPFGCGPTSDPYCPATAMTKNTGWSGSKMFVFLASMPHPGSGGVTAAQSCLPATHPWADAPVVGLTVGEMARSGLYSACHCYENTLYRGDGCGQINALQVINENDATGNVKNLEVFSSNFWGYGGIFGGPCGSKTCDTSALGGNVDLVAGNKAAEEGAVGSQRPVQNPKGFLRRPSTGFRYFIVLLDVKTRTVQLAIVHPQKIPAPLAGLLPNLPLQLPPTAIDGVVQLRLPR